MNGWLPSHTFVCNLITSLIVVLLIQIGQSLYHRRGRSPQPLFQRRDDSGTIEVLRPSSQRPQAQRHVQAQKSTRPEQSLEQVLRKSRDDAGDDNDDIDTNDLLLQEEVDEPMQRQQQRPTKVYITQEKDDRIDRRDEYHENDNIGKLGKRTESMKDSPTHSRQIRFVRTTTELGQPMRILLIVLPEI